jgi:hypothetical protein
MRPCVFVHTSDKQLVSARLVLPLERGFAAETQRQVSRSRALRQFLWDPNHQSINPHVLV